VTGDGGFTLIELMVAVAILALAAALFAPGRLGGSEVLEGKSAAREIAAGLRRARSAAIVSGTETVFLIDVDKRVYAAPGAAPAPLPAKARLAMRTGAAELKGGGSGGIRFFPDGGSTGGGVSLEEGGRSWTIRVDWMTGRVDVDEAS
jgi:general secretion pathway protein H